MTRFGEDEYQISVLLYIYDSWKKNFHHLVHFLDSDCGFVRHFYREMVVVNQDQPADLAINTEGADQRINLINVNEKW